MTYFFILFLVKNIFGSGNWDNGNCPKIFNNLSFIIVVLKCTDEYTIILDNSFVVCEINRLCCLKDKRFWRIRHSHFLFTGNKHFSNPTGYFTTFLYSLILLQTPIILPPLSCMLSGSILTIVSISGTPLSSIYNRDTSA